MVQVPVVRADTEVVTYKAMIPHNTNNVKNMHPHWDSNPGSWNTVPML